MSRETTFGGHHDADPLMIIDPSDAPSSSPQSVSDPIRSCLGQMSGSAISGNECSICLESMMHGKRQALFTAECGHTFHFSCIASNVKHGNQICPVCRATWKDLPWQAGGQDVSGSQRGRTSGFDHRRAHFMTSSSDDRLPIWSPSRDIRYPREPDHYDDDEPLNLNQSALLDPPEGILSSSGSSQDQKVSVELLPEFSAVPACESRESFGILIHLKAPAARSASIADAPVSSLPPSGSRAPLDLVAVLDISGSMGSGRKLMLLKQAMNFVVGNLSAADRLSVVAFSSTAKRIFALRKMGGVGQHHALQAIDALRATGETNIAEGLRKGVKVLEDRREKNSVCAIMLLSDGLDSFGMNSQRQLPPFLSLLGGQIPVHTFGFGSDHDAATMHSIAEVSGATFSYIQAVEGVQDAFAQCIGGLLSVVAQDVQITVSCVASGVLISSIHSGSYDSSIHDSAQRGMITLGDLYADEERDIMVDLKLPALSESEGEISMPLVQAACTYKDVVTQEVNQNTAEELFIMRPLTVEEAQQVISLDVDRQRNRLRTAEAIADARGLADQGNIEAAQRSIQNARLQLVASPSAHAGDALSSLLESELNEIQERTASRQVYESSGRAYVLSAVSSHSRQRASTRGDSRARLTHEYQTPSMVNMVTRSRSGLPTGVASSPRFNNCDSATIAASNPLPHSG